jgi:hypothetical protein
VESIDVRSAVGMEGQVMEPWRVPVVLSTHTLWGRRLQRDAEDAAGDVGYAPTRRSGARLGKLLVAELAKNLLVERPGPRQVLDGEIYMAEGAADHARVPSRWPTDWAQGFER